MDVALMSGAVVFVASSGGCSDVGHVRSVNEDAWLERPDIGLWAVADGMGGHHAGDLASHLVIQKLRAVARPSRLGALVCDVCCQLRVAHDHLRQEAERRSGSLIGTTVAVFLAFGVHCVYLWAGDSRIYLLRQGRLHQLTRDHTRVEDLIGRGLLRREDGRNHPDVNVITRAVGGSPTLELDARIAEVCNGDTYALCTDGLIKEVDDGEIAKLLTMADTRESSTALLDRALRRDARDNVTVIVVRFLID